jgi:hypothetical protein
VNEEEQVVVRSAAGQFKPFIHRVFRPRFPQRAAKRGRGVPPG